MCSSGNLSVSENVAFGNGDTYLYELAGERGEESVEKIVKVIAFEGQRVDPECLDI